MHLSLDLNPLGFCILFINFTNIHTSTPLRFRGKDVCFHIFVRFCCISSSFPLHRLKSYCLSGTLLRLYQSSTLEIQRSVFTPICSVKIGEIGDSGASRFCRRTQNARERARLRQKIRSVKGSLGLHPAYVRDGA